MTEQSLEEIGNNENRIDFSKGEIMTASNRARENFEIIEKIFGNGPLNVAGFEKLGLEKFQKKNYKDLEILGEGAFGKVTKALEIKKRYVVALKEISLIKAETRENFLLQVSSLLVEKNINNEIKKHPDAEKYFAEVYGVYYDLDNGEKEVKKVIMISEAGDYNLEDILNLRKTLKRPYTEEEALEIVRHLAEAYRILQETGIYHCDTKLDNIMLSKSKNSYLVIDLESVNL